MKEAKAVKNKNMLIPIDLDTFEKVDVARKEHCLNWSQYLRQCIKRKLSELNSTKGQ